MSTFQLRIPFRSGGSFPFGTVIDHWVVTYVSGPTVFSTQTIPAGEQYVNYQGILPGAYVLQFQAQDASNTPIGGAINLPVNIPDNIGTAAANIPVRARFVGNPGGLGSGQATMQVLYQSLGMLAPGQAIDHSVITLSGPSTSIAIVPAGATTANFTGLANGNYSYAIQAYDNNGIPFGPQMSSDPGGICYFDEALTTQFLPIASSPLTIVPQPGQGSNIGPGP